MPIQSDELRKLIEEARRLRDRARKLADETDALHRKIEEKEARKPNTRKR